MPTAYYNEIDPKAAAWLRDLIAQRLIPDGHVDTRSICEVQPSDLAGFVQCHFFSGIGGWPEALRLAGVPSDFPLWTGSCPCQPFSASGKQKGEADERHLWPEFRRLIAECRPPVVFGEQVASRLGREWLSGVRADLEELGYAVGASDLCAAGVGAPHIRQRLYWGACRVADSVRERRRRGEPRREDAGDAWESGEDGGVADAAGQRRTREPVLLRSEAGGRDEGGVPETPGSGSTFWSHSILIPCRDGKARRIEPTIFPLAHGVPGRVGLLRGAGNAIVPQVAATFIGAFLDAVNSK